SSPALHFGIGATPRQLRLRPSLFQAARYRWKTLLDSERGLQSPLLSTRNHQATGCLADAGRETGWFAPNIYFRRIRCHGRPRAGFRTGALPGNITAAALSWPRL